MGERPGPADKAEAGAEAHYNAALLAVPTERADLSRTEKATVDHLDRAPDT